MKTLGFSFFAERRHKRDLAVLFEVWASALRQSYLAYMRAYDEPNGKRRITSNQGARQVGVCGSFAPQAKKTLQAASY